MRAVVQAFHPLAEIEGGHQFAVIEPNQRRMPGVDGPQMGVRIPIDRDRLHNIHDALT